MFYLQVMHLQDTTQLQEAAIKSDYIYYPREIEDEEFIMINGMFSCSQCSYVNNHKQNFKKHLMTHTGERPYACPLCSYRALQKHHLDNHIKRHTGEKPFACIYCPYKTGRKESLKYHIYVKHSK